MCSSDLQRSSRVVDGARPNDDKQAIVLAMHDVVYVFTGLGDQLFHRRALNREEANQMLRWGENGDVFDPLVVGLTGFFNRFGVEGFVCFFHGYCLKSLRCAANCQSIDAQSGLTNTHWHALAFFTAGANA